MAGEDSSGTTQTAPPPATGNLPGKQPGADQSIYWGPHTNATRQAGVLSTKADEADRQSKTLQAQAEQRGAQTTQLEKQIESNDAELSKNQAAESSGR